MRRFATEWLTTLTGMALMVIGTSGVLRASTAGQVPEVNPSVGLAALTLVAGAVVVVRGRRAKK